MPTCRLHELVSPGNPPQVELHQENNAHLAYWLSNTVTLLYLMQKNVKPASGGGYTARLRAQGAQVGKDHGPRPGRCCRRNACLKALRVLVARVGAARPRAQ